jgi:hypothetical protein
MSPGSTATATSRPSIISAASPSGWRKAGRRRPGHRQPVSADEVDQPSRPSRTALENPLTETLLDDVLRSCSMSTRAAAMLAGPAAALPSILTGRLTHRLTDDERESDTLLAADHPASPG